MVVPAKPQVNLYVADLGHPIVYYGLKFILYLCCVVKGHESLRDHEGARHYGHAALPVEELRNPKKKGIRHLPVVDDQDRLIGIISDKDLRQALVPAERIGEEKRYFYFKNLVFVKDVMTQEPLFVRPDTDVERAAYLMFTKKLARWSSLKNGES